MFWHFSSINSDTDNSAGKCQISPSSWGGGVGRSVLMPLPLPAFIAKNFHTCFPSQIWFCQRIQWVYNTGIVVGNVSALNGIPDVASHRILRQRQLNLFYLNVSLGVKNPKYHEEKKNVHCVSNVMTWMRNKIKSVLCENTEPYSGGYQQPLCKRKCILQT